MYKHKNEQAGLTLVELMVALAIGSFLIIGAVQIYNQSRQAFVINESIARVQETAQFAMDTIEADLRLASNWGRTSRVLSIEGRSIPGGNPDPDGLIVAGQTDLCGADWVLDLTVPVDGENNNFSLPCAAQGGAQAASDLITVRRASLNPAVPTAGRLQIHSSRSNGRIFNDGTPPEEFDGLLADPFDPANPSFTHNLLVNSYYVGQPSNNNLIPGVPTLRRKTLAVLGGVSTIVDQEVAPGVENLQVQLGVDVDADHTVDRYVNVGDDIYNPSAPGYVPGARVITARIWLVVRGISQEPGIRDARDYEPGDVDLGTYNDNFRRLQVSKTILLRNTRS